MLSVGVVSYHPFAWPFQSILLNFDHTAFCTILMARGVVMGCA